MAKFSDERVEEIVEEYLGEKKAVRRFDPEMQAARDVRAAAADVGTPDLAALRRKYLASGPAEEASRTDSRVAAPDGDILEDEIVTIPSDDDSPSTEKSIVISGEDEDVIGVQG